MQSALPFAMQMATQFTQAKFNPSPKTIRDMQKLYEIYFPEGSGVLYTIVGLAVALNVVVLGTHWLVEKYSGKPNDWSKPPSKDD